MGSSTLTIKGQVTVPKELRDALGWKAGDAVDLVRLGDGVQIVRQPRRSKGREVVAKLRQVRWKAGLTTDRLMRLTRG